MEIKKIITSFLLFSITVLGTGLSQDSSDSALGERAKRLDEFVQSFMTAYQIPGLAFAVVENNRMVFAHADGVDNLETRRPLSVKSIFHLASVSKPFTATAIMQLVEQGKMQLDDPLIKYLPYFKLDDPRCREITIKQMLTHTSGIPDVHDYEWDQPQFDDGAAERYVRSLANEKMVAGPGEKWLYSNMAFDILADVIAKVSGMTFEDYLKENILNPLEMVESDFLRARIKPELRVSAHVFDLQPIPSQVYPYNRRHAPSSCLNANVVEMCNWAIVNLSQGEFKGKRILTAASSRILFEPQAEIGENRAIGLSWFLEQRGDLKIIAHGGGDLGFRSYLLMVPEKSLAVVAASNFEGTPIDDVAYGVMEIMLGLVPQKPKIPIIMTLGKTLASDGMQKAMEQYRHLKRFQPEAYDFSEAQLNLLGYLLIGRKRLDQAIEVFKLNVEMFPEAFNTYDSLAEAYMLDGQKELAIENYRKSIALNPNNSNAIKMLEKLQGKTTE